MTQHSSAGAELETLIAACAERGSHTGRTHPNVGDIQLKQLMLCAGVFFAIVANAALTSRATLVGQHMHVSASGGSALICEYSGMRAKFEIISQHGSCAPYIDVQ